jgi:hypothetical protein
MVFEVAVLRRPRMHDRTHGLRRVLRTETSAPGHEEHEGLSSTDFPRTGIPGAQSKNEVRIPTPEEPRIMATKKAATPKPAAKKATKATTAKRSPKAAPAKKTTAKRSPKAAAAKKPAAKTAAKKAAK